MPITRLGVWSMKSATGQVPEAMGAPDGAAPAPEADAPVAPTPEATPEQAMADIRNQFGWVNRYGDEGGKKGILDSEKDVTGLVTAWAKGEVPDQQMGQLLAKIPPSMRQRAIKEIQASKGFGKGSWFGSPPESRRAEMLKMLGA